MRSLAFLALAGLVVAACAAPAPALAQQPKAAAAAPVQEKALAAQPAAAAPAAQPPVAAKPVAPAAQPAAPAKAVAVTPRFSTDPQVLEAAKKEGKVIYYTARTQTDAEAMAKRFAELTGIKVEVTRLSAGPQFDRVMREQQAGLKVTVVVDPAEVKGELQNIRDRFADTFGG